MVEIAAVLVAVVAAIVFVMRMDEDPSRWTPRRRGTRRGRSSESVSSVDGVMTDPTAAEATPD